MEKKKRFYKDGELVYIKSLNKSGKIEKVIVDTKNSTYKAKVLVDGEIHVLNLWDISKHKRTLMRLKTKKPTVLWSKVKPTAIIPTKEEENAGYDIYACFDEDFMVIEPHQTVMIPTGVAYSLTNDYFFDVRERGSTGVRTMCKRAGVLDAGFRNEIMILMTNGNNVPLYIAKDGFTAPSNTITYPYEKAIAQLILEHVIDANHKEIPYEELLKIESNRGTGMLGSSGK